MNRTSPEPADGQLLGGLKALWERADPMPPDLPDRVLFALELEDLDGDFELLRLVTNAAEDLSVRSAATELNTITFSSPSVTVMLRITALRGSRRRLDGWLAAPAALLVKIRHSQGTHEADVDGQGRFVAADLPAGLTRLVLTPAGDEHASPILTPTVEI